MESRAPKSAATDILLTRTRRLGVGALPQITFSLASLTCTNILFCASVRADIADSRILGLISDVPGTSVRLIAASSAQAPKQLLRHPSLLYSPLPPLPSLPAANPQHHLHYHSRFCQPTQALGIHVNFSFPGVAVDGTDRMSDMDSNGLKRKDTTKGPPLRILSLGITARSIRGSVCSAVQDMLTHCQTEEACAATPCS